MARNNGNIGTVSMNLTLNTNSFNNSLNGVQRNVGSIASGFSKVQAVGIAAFTAITAAAVKFGKDSLSAFSKAEQGAMKLYATLSGQGINFNSADSFIDKFVEDGLVELDKAQEAYANLAQMGMDTSQIEKMMQVMKDSASVGRQAGYTIGDAMATATEGMKQGLSNKTDNVGITTNLSQMEDEYKKLYGIVGDLTQEQKNQAYVNGFLKEGAKYTGTAAKMTQTYTGTVSALSTQFNNLKVNMGSVLSHVVQPIIQGLTIIITKLNNVVKAWANTLNTIFKTKTPKDFFTDASNQTKDISETVSEGTTSIGESASNAAKKITRAVAPFDKLNKIADTSSSSGSSSGGSSSPSSSSSQEEVKNTSKESDGLSKKISHLKELWNKGWNSNFKADTTKLKTNIDRLKNDLKGIFTNKELQNAMANFGDTFIESLGGIAGGIASIGTSISILLTGGIANALEKNKTNIIKWFTDILKEASSFINQIKEYIGAIADIFTVFEGINAENVFGDLISIVGNIFGTITGLCSRFVTDITTLVTQPIIDNVDKIKIALDSFLGSFSNITSGLNTLITNLGQDLISLYDEHIRPVFEALTSSFSEWFGIILDGYNKYIAPVIEKLSQKSQALMEKLSPILTTLKDAIGDIIDIIKIIWQTYLSPFISWILKHIMPVLGTLLNVLGSVALFLADKFVDAIGFAVDAIKGITGFLKDLVSITATVFNKFIKLKDGIVGAFKSIPDAIKGAINSVISLVNKMIDSINKISIDIPSLTGGDSKHIGFNIQHIPALANGGYVGPNSPQLVQIGDNRRYGELVANDKQLDGLGNKIINGVVSALHNVSGNNPIYLTVQLGDEDITDIVATSLNRYSKRTGKKIM